MSEINFEPFQKVLVRSTNTMQWSAALYSHKCGEKHICNGIIWTYCIQYEGNEHLLGTPSSPTEPEFKFGDRVEVSDDQENWFPAIFYRIRTHCRARFFVLRPTGTGSWPYCRKANW